MGQRVRNENDSLHCPTCGASFSADFQVCPRDGVQLAAGTDPMIDLELLGTYRITHVLGEGALGRVYHANHVRLARSYALWWRRKG